MRIADAHDMLENDICYLRYEFYYKCARTDLKAVNATATFKMHMHFAELTNFKDNIEITEIRSR